jgi:hypothetical protein
MAVCEYCRASIIKDGESVKDVGKLSAVLEDYSPIQIGTAGTFEGRGFSVVGRIQLRYAQGMWNEWYLLFDDAGAGWLGDASGQYTVTTTQAVSGALPSFEEISPGNQYPIGGERYTAADKREGECIGGQGELPFRVGDGWRIRAVDLRRAQSFVTLDYTDGVVPLVYGGKAVTLPDLKCQLLRSDDVIKETAGRFRGKLSALDCPSCGSAIKYVPGVTATLVCPACSAQLDAAGPEATILAAGAKVDQVFHTLELGAQGGIAGDNYSVIGAMVRADDEGATWTEYLLHGLNKGGFLWLVETDEGWSRARVLDVWPEWRSPGAGQVTYEGAVFDKLYDYDATVRYAAGAFNWRVAVGDTAHVYEFKKGSANLSAELTAEELTWSHATPVAADQVMAWFGKGASANPAKPAAQQTGVKPLFESQLKYVWWILGLNAIPLIVNFGGTFWILLLALFALFYPAKYFQGDEE